MTRSRLRTGTILGAYMTLCSQYVDDVCLDGWSIPDMMSVMRDHFWVAPLSEKTLTLYRNEMAEVGLIKYTLDSKGTIVRVFLPGVVRCNGGIKQWKRRKLGLCPDDTDSHLDGPVCPEESKAFEAECARLLALKTAETS